MAIPDFQTLMLPVMKFASTRQEHSLKEAVDYLKNEFHITPDEYRQTISSGTQPVFYNRVGWARSYLKQSGLLEPTKRNYLKVTERGRQVLKENPSRIDMNYLKIFPEFVAFREKTKEPAVEPEGQEGTLLTPEETLNDAYKKIKGDLALQLLENIINNTPVFFERLVVDVLVKMGYGGSDTTAGHVVGKSGDEGIDGIIDEDKLGLDRIYIQAKKWSENPVGRSEIQKFVGALQGKRAKKGIFITASTFTDQAKDYASNIETKIVLIDGHRLADLMIEYNVGVSIVSTFEIKRLDSDYFNVG